MTVEHDLSARLSALADDLTWADPAVSPEAAIARHRRQRRTRAGLAVAVAAVVALVIAVPTAIGSLSADPGEAAGPGAPTAPVSTGPDAEAEARAAAESAAAEARQQAAGEEVARQQAAAAAAAAAAEQAAQSELDALAATFDGPLTLSSPAAWDQWLPEGKPYPGTSTEEEMATCPRLSDRLGAAFGMEFSYWTGTLPNGPSGCTWVPVPLSYDGPYDYAYMFDVGFLGDGTTVEQLRGSFFQGGAQTASPGSSICPSADVGGGGAIVVCHSDERYDGQWQLLVPDARGAGTWVLSATARTDTGRTSAEALAVLVEGVRATYG